MSKNHPMIVMLSGLARLAPGAAIGVPAADSKAVASLEIVPSHSAC